MEMSNKPTQIKVYLKGDLLHKFMFLKKKLGIAANAEVVRYLVALEYERISSRSE